MDPPLSLKAISSIRKRNKEFDQMIDRNSDDSLENIEIEIKKNEQFIEFSPKISQSR